MSELTKKQPTIYYGEQAQAMTNCMQYLLARAGMSEGMYSKDDFVVGLLGVQFGAIKNPQLRTDLRDTRSHMIDHTRMGSSITVENFNPDPAELEARLDEHYRKISE